MGGNWPVLAAGAISVGFLHTVLGPDHYLPFVALGSARGWTRRKLAVVTVLCGSAHILSSLLIALVVGGLLGLGASRVEEVFGWQGSAVAWALVVLGLGYAVWSLVRKRHKHQATHDVTVWALFIIFLFGPCEAMIPLVMLPTAEGSVALVVMVLVLFGVVTVVTMTAVVLLLHSGVRLVPSGWLARAAHPLAGGVVALCGVAILFGL